MVSIYNIKNSRHKNNNSCKINDTFVDIWWSCEDSPKKRSTILTQQVLSKYNVGNKKTTIYRTKRGKPYLNPPVISFSISHTKHFYVIAVTNHPNIGLDCEEINRKIKNFHSIVAYAFQSKNKFEFQQLPSYLSSYSFFRGWTKYEAYCKYFGYSIFHVTPYIVNLWNCAPSYFNEFTIFPISIHPLLISSISLPCTQHVLKIS